MFFVCLFFSHVSSFRVQIYIVGLTETCYIRCLFICVTAAVCETGEDVCYVCV